MEELIPIVGRLAEQYTSGESTSLTYEKAEQLMGAVLYCIHETELAERNAVLSTDTMMAQQAYEAGVKCVEQKAKKVLSEWDLEPSDYARMQGKLARTELHDIRRRLQEGIERFVQKYCGDNSQLAEYLVHALDGIAIRLKNMAEYDSFPGNFAEMSGGK